MDALTPPVEEVTPTDARLGTIFERHLTLMRASSPACSVHAMDAQSLAASGVRFFAVFEEGQAIAMGALKRISPEHGELKSMHVAHEARGRGLARAVLARLLAAARAEGMGRVSLETGSQPAFAAARALYRSAGFESCEPFEGYGPDPNSAFLTRAL